MAATNGSKAQARRTKSNAKRTAKSAGRTAKAAVPEKSQFQTVAETAVDLPVGAVLTVAERLSDLAEPWTDRSGAEKQIKAYRTQLRKSLKRTERRGATARRKATTEARRNRREAEQRVRKAIDEQTARAQDLVDQVTEQLSSLR